MKIADSAARLAATLLAIVHNRVELASTELEEQSLRFFSCLMLALASLFFFGLAVVLGVLLLLTVYWDSHRIAVLAVLAGVFGFAGILAARLGRQRYRERPPLLGHTMNELARDSELLQPPA